MNSYGSALYVNDESHQNIILCPSGGIVTIGDVTPNGNYKLFVREGIRTEAIKVDLANANGWSDYVFDTKYKLLELQDLELFIKSNKHLPGIPSAEEAVANGVDLLDMDSRLLAKIEELTLYIIEQDKRIKFLESKNK